MDFRTGRPWMRVAFHTTLFRKDTEGLCGCKCILTCVYPEDSGDTAAPLLGL